MMAGSVLENERWMSAGKASRIIPTSDPAALLAVGATNDGMMEERVPSWKRTSRRIKADVALMRSNYATRLDVADLRVGMHEEIWQTARRNDDEFGKYVLRCTPRLTSCVLRCTTRC